MMQPGTPFGNLMAEAVKLKGAQQATLRPVWDSWPQYFQHSMFLQEPIVSARQEPFEARLRLANEIKAQGNSHFGKGEFEEAVAQYEKALALFKYCENTDPDWKKKGIRDDDIIVVDYKADNAGAQAELDTLKNAQQRKLDKQTFSGMFNRGTIVDDTDATDLTAPDKTLENQKRLRKEVRELDSGHFFVTHVENQVDDAEMVARMYEQSGKVEEAKELRQKIDQAKAAIRARPPRVDFMNPTPEMIEDGKKNGCATTVWPRD
ncbi:hypothetical protein DYB32_009100 [Aphanomyces invadans]|uniref:Uncharacterized protein n=1 Tax=Aphanomyces invadans TaxID=157072 RepID=A0A418AJD1_9STRA|nr:hypothetical protein DYB32_009100 [Aphanomyces invadans]